ncbi:MAG: dihydrodipicolinate synthase family protein, partial [Acidimicrobiia bacterium]|nr:dihydrodipicolinate synthase family protein [Acidimicrobiia bacterium]
DTIDLTRHAVDLGVHQALVLPPFYLKPVTDEGLTRSFSEIIEGVSSDVLAITAYHFPRLSGVPIPTVVLNRLGHSYGPVISGVKDSTGDPASLTTFLDACPELDIFPGSETLLLTGLRRGSSGVITAGANVNPRMLRAIYDNPETADALQDRATAIRSEIQAHGTVPATKALLAHFHEDEGWLGMRAPLTQSQLPDGKALASAIGALGYEWPQLP